MNDSGSDSKTLLKNIAKILENIEVDDMYLQKSIDDIKNIYNKLNKNETNCEKQDKKNN